MGYPSFRVKLIFDAVNAVCELLYIPVGLLESNFLEVDRLTDPLLGPRF